MSDNIKLTMDWDDIAPSPENDYGKKTNVPISDALLMSLANKGRVDMKYIRDITGDSLEMIVETLGGSVYQNPETWQEDPEMGWETSEEYLSGNIYKKLVAANNANKNHKCFGRNIKALSELLPEFVQPENIYVTLGSPWVPAHVIDDYIEHLFAPAYKHHFIQKLDHRVKHDEFGWEIPFKNRYGYSVLVTKTYGTSRLNALHILEMTLNMKAAVVYDEVNSPTTKSGTARVLNEEESMMAIEKQQLMIREFKDWVWKDESRKNELMDIFESKYACNRKRIFNGSYLTFPGLSEDVTLYPYQKDAVSRILMTPNTLLAHEVGSGKTYIMIGAGMEAKRLGLSSKNMYVVPNSIVGQWKDLFYKMYPDANLLCVEPKSFVLAKRQQVLEQIRDNDYDGIIIAYSCFDSISLSHSHYIQALKEEKSKLERLVNNRSKATIAVKAKLRAVSEKLSKMTVQGNQDKGLICFDELGITRLFIDEAHNFKNVPLETKTNLAKGIYATGSKKCQHMMDKVRFVQKQNNGGGIVMATGTPITNSVSDIYIMQKYLQSGELALLDLYTFDSWIGMFAERSTEFEIDVDTNSYKLTTRFSAFHNLPELTSLVSSFTDFHRIDESENLPAFQEYTDISVPKSEALCAFLDDISVRADDVRRKKVRRTEDNLLKITTDGRKAALDMRLIDEKFTSLKVSKVSACAKQVADLYYMVPDKRTQLIFCDISTPKEGFNIYDEMKASLVLRGIPGSEIAYIHDADSESKRDSVPEVQKR